MAHRGPRVAVVPFADDQLLQAVADGGGEIGDPAQADAVVWTNPLDAQALKELLQSSSPAWVQLPFAGIEEFIAAGAVDDRRLWTCTKGVYGPACAEHALALMLAAARRLHTHARASTWRPTGLGSPERRLAGCTVLIVGTGGIGRALAQMLQPFDVRILAVNRSGRPLEEAERTVTFHALREVVGLADFVVVAAALTGETHRLFDGSVFRLMKQDAWLVNVARGGLVDTEALVEALQDNRIGGAALDVTDPEPLPDGHPLWSLENVLVTPHIANTWDMALPELRALVRRNVQHFARGEPLEGVVDVSLGY